MPLRLYNTLSRQVEEFAPLEPGQVKMYVCGPTVYADAHIGHAMAALVFDMVRRYLTYRGYRVTYVTNFTDVDDKIIRRANETGQDPIEMANAFAQSISNTLTTSTSSLPTSTPKSARPWMRSCAAIWRPARGRVRL